MTEIQLTDHPGGHILTNTAVWSPDGEWIVYDTRSDPAGTLFDGDTIEIVHVDTREVREIYRAKNGAHCGVATFSPTAARVVFILGPENPTDDWQYGPSHRQGVIVDLARPGNAIPLDGRNLVPPFTPGALRGGSHVHVFSGDGQWVSFTYDDALLAGKGRIVGVCDLSHRVAVPRTHPRNHDGSAVAALITETVEATKPGSNEISRAFEDAWIGAHGYLRADGTRQQRAIAFQGEILTPTGKSIREVFVVDLPEDITIPGAAPLEGTTTALPSPPRGTTQRRLTFTEHRKYAGLQGPRHWLRSSPDGAQIALLMRDDDGIVQLWTVSPWGGEPVLVTRHPFDIASAFSWSPDGKSLAYVADGSIFVTDVANERSQRLTPRSDAALSPRPEACVFSPTGRQIAYLRPLEQNGQLWNQVFVVTLPGEPPAST